MKFQFFDSIWCFSAQGETIIVIERRKIHVIYSRIHKISASSKDPDGEDEDDGGSVRSDRDRATRSAY